MSDTIIALVIAAFFGGFSAGIFIGSLIWGIPWPKRFLARSKPVVYPGFHCGCCGAWVEKEWSCTDPSDEYFDTIGICDVCLKGGGR